MEDGENISNRQTRMELKQGNVQPISQLRFRCSLLTTFFNFLLNGFHYRESFELVLTTLNLAEWVCDIPKVKKTFCQTKKGFQWGKIAFISL